ncbi:TraB/GumN family protein [Tabrizicola sp.]|uniref:TraB/GumN family protein n=1 Tax=Tabrizicola sp. TaxID=2005166 RepID=UPI00260DBF0C|nr:TraB/GumN family protein [Tabrizicola sp.]MDM7931349.1 TraB/GumN family protein [Tabrizicola sp.]
MPSLPLCLASPRLCLAGLATAFGLLSAPVAADCNGRNLFDDMPADRVAAIEAAANAVPFPTGNYWRATRGDEVITLIGTYHFDDPRHLPTLDVITPEITAAATVLVEAGPDEEKQLLDLIARDPSKIMITDGPTLIEQLPPDIWSGLSEALALRGVPGFMAAKFQPWYAIIMLAVPPCAMARMADPKGLDGLVIDTARAAGVPVRGLEPFDTVFSIFDNMTKAEMVAMLQSTLAVEDRVEDYSATLADSYFAGENRLIWEFLRFVTYEMPGYTRDQVDAEYARMEELLMNTRNRGWIPVLTEAAANGPVFAAFGALHLSGEAGVLNLLAAEGYTLTELPL